MRALRAIPRRGGRGGWRSDYRAGDVSGWFARSRSPGSGPGFVCRSAGRPNVLLLEHPVLTVPAQRVHPVDGRHQVGGAVRTRLSHPRVPGRGANVRALVRMLSSTSSRCISDPAGSPPARVDRARDHPASHRPIHSGRRNVRLSLSPRLRHQVLPPPDVQAAGDGPWQDALLNDRGQWPGPFEGLVIRRVSVGHPAGTRGSRESSRQRI